ncbi:MAG: FtsW/RodA/SpoVE family cell cycle protein [Faecalibacterium prausnitzii]
MGVTLPFYSAGGSSVLMLYICVGLVLSVYMHNTKNCLVKSLSEQALSFSACFIFRPNLQKSCNTTEVVIEYSSILSIFF